MLWPLPCYRTFNGSLLAFTRASSKSPLAGLRHYHHLLLPDNTFLTRQTLAPALPWAFAYAALLPVQLKGENKKGDTRS